MKYPFSSGLLVLTLSSLLLSGCYAGSQETSPRPQTAERIFTNADIITMNPSAPNAQAIVIGGGKIMYVGDNQTALAFATGNTQVTPLDGLTLLPGIHDSHVHALEGGSEVGGNCWLEGESINDLKQPLLNCRKKQQGSPWLLAYGHELESLLEVDSPRALLDSWISDRPVAVMEQTSHSVWVNSKGLALAGITAASPDPIGGIILRDAQGEPNGILLEAAGEAIFDLALKPTAESFDINYDGLIWAMDELARNGITSIADARVYWQRGWLDVWNQAEKDQALKTRVNLGLWAYPNIDDEQQLTFLKTHYRYNPNRLLQVNQIKIYSDGIIHNTTAALKAPYKSSLKPVPPLGLNYFTESKLSRYIRELQSVGFDFHIHTIGDRGVHEALNAIEQNLTARPDHRHRLTHVEMIDDIDLPRFASLNVIADIQVAGDFTLPKNHHWQEPYIGARAYSAYRLGDLTDSGARVVLSSDWTVSSLNPFVGIHNAVNRGEQSISVMDALKAYTINAAYLMRSEQRTGSLEVGKAADMIVVDQNIFSIPPARLRDTRVLLTIMNGQVTWQDKDF